MNFEKLVYLADRFKPIDRKQVYKTKKDFKGDGRYKEKCVRRGFTKREGIDYAKTISPINRFL